MKTAPPMVQLTTPTLRHNCTKVGATVPFLSSLSFLLLFVVFRQRFVFLLRGEPWVRSGVDATLPPVGDLPASRWPVLNRSVWRLSK
jgi:hypothetical protein